MQAVRLLTNWILGILLTLIVQRWDQKRLDDDQRMRGWNSVTRAQAIFNFGPWSLLGWGWVTRRWPGLFLGFGAASLLSFALVIVDMILVAMFGE
jgi:hypothetical protein